jgi:hypothetical protein
MLFKSDIYKTMEKMIEKVNMYKNEFKGNRIPKFTQQLSRDELDMNFDAQSNLSKLSGIRRRNRKMKTHKAKISTNHNHDSNVNLLNSDRERDRGFLNPSTITS